MSIIGIIAEFNPFHNGHKFLIDSVKNSDDKIVCVIGDDFTQRGDTAIISKYARAESALKCGADLCVLLPSMWSMSGANNFAYGAMSILKSLGCIDKVVFGSECGNIEKITAVSSYIHSEELSSYISKELKNGQTFASARQKALKKMIGKSADILSNSNDNLATEYIYAAKTLDFTPQFEAIARVGNKHDSPLADNEFLSATAIRDMILNNNIDNVKKYLPKESYDVLVRELKNGHISSISNIENAILSYLRRLSLEDILNSPEISEGIENRILSSISNSSSLEECYNGIKTKRYTMARIRRIILSAYLGIDNSFQNVPVPYIKVLGFNKSGEKIIKNLSTCVPIIMRSNDYLSLEGFAKACFDLQNKATNLYNMSLENIKPCNSELKEKLIKI